MHLIDNVFVFFLFEILLYFMIVNFYSNDNLIESFWCHPVDNTLHQHAGGEWHTVGGYVFLDERHAIDYVGDA
jgi:hypothetical protein